MLHLVLFEGSERRAVVVGDSPFVIGRSSESHLQLSDVQVSRRHAELREDESGWRIRDCGSRFGTFVNDVKTDEAALSPGDRIRLGQTELRVEPGDTGTSSAPFDFRQVNALLAGLRALGSSQVLDEVLVIVLDSALEVTGAERGFILLAEPDGRLELRLARARGGITLKSAQTSRRIPEEVFQTGTDRIVTDLMDEGLAVRHAGTVALGIRHVLCTPLKVVQYAAGGERRIGVLYLDSRERGYLRSAGLLHALAAEAAVVIENARLYQEVVGKERVEQELRIAAEMQRALLPPPRAQTESAELAAITIPCRSVGGDLFDYSIQDGTMSFAVADVAGKGSSAALLSAVVQGLFAAEVDSTDGPAAVLTRINRSLCRRALAARFVTVFFGQLESTGTLRYCNGGHNPPLLVSRRGVDRLDVGGTVLGLFATGTFENASVQLGAGDALVLFSDGVTEAEDAEGREFGEEGLIQCLGEAPFDSAAELLERVRDALGKFCGSAPPRDDLTLMVVVAR